MTLAIYLLCFVTAALCAWLLLRQADVALRAAKAAGKTASLARRAALKAGKKPRYCPPEGPQKMDSDEFMTRLAAIPRPDRQRISMTEAMNRILTAKFPCR